ncbi:diguanylate cyclase [Sulfuricurvum kujiense DSM 16994]|uniref:diguanylate cyclase n=1 Tax=Sulfuricurvum kujiense (strain ATCC BAA-921 / DSM 16994 / JCM 11577 / YK-1) TaxID=709032 RepID=E4U0K1_SULKY|nr:diguanylate cyclase [Sulfuricurvum kujiense]ADR34318.1 diguanylate cyclase [Sulfuricurvum kujiense DSM 16994]
MQAQELKASFTKRYVIAISLIALLSTGAFYFLHLGLKTSASTALIVNMSGKQRMLSQRVASLSQQYYFYSNSNNAHLEAVRADLLLAIEEMARANAALSSGRLKEGVEVKLSPEILEIYYGEIALKKRVEQYLERAKSLSQTPSQNESAELLREIVHISNTLLQDLNTAVFQYQIEGEKNIAEVKQLETLVWIVTLITLLLEVIFIFQPMAHKIQELFQEVLWNQENLEQQISIRTMSLEHANTKLLQMASHDPLTGLKNRLNMERDLEELITQFDKHHLPYAVLMLDIDWFKKINDSYGHDAGDFVLCEISKIMLENVRVQDSVYRAGGEEFVIIFNRITREQAIEKAEEIRINIQKHQFVFDNQVLQCTVSGGIYHPDIRKSSTVQGVLKLADNALYEAKHSGRNNIVEAKHEKFNHID